MRLPSEVEPFTAERRRMRAWWRPHRSLPPEALFLLVVAAIALGLCSAAAPPRPAVTASVAPACSDAAQPCRGRP